MKFAYQRWMIRAALIYLVIGVSLGFVMYLAPLFPDAGLYRFRSVHIHLLLVGFMLQIVMGVALWMFPRMAVDPHYTPPRRGMTLFVLLNCGVFLRSAGELYGMVPVNTAYFVGLAGAGLQLIAILFFLSLILSRVRGVNAGKHS